MNIDTRDLRAPFAQMPVEKLREIVSNSGNEYTADAQAVAREELDGRPVLDESAAQIGSELPLSNHERYQRMPARVKEAVAPNALLGLGFTFLLLAAPFVDVSLIRLFTSVEGLKFGLITTVAWLVAVGIHTERLYVHTALLAVYLGFALYLVILAVAERSPLYGVAVLLPLWQAWRFRRDPSVTEYYQRMRERLATTNNPGPYGNHANA